ncbi:MAG: sigma-70 family RNA polymerase sigma factor [Novosphingobium sp.]
MIADDRSLSRLMALAQKGDREAYAALLDAAQDWLRRYFARRVSPFQLDDLIQETLLSVHAKRASFDPSRPFLPWLAAIARFRWIDCLRQVYRNEHSELGEDIAAPAEEPGISARISLERLLAHLPEGQVEAIKLVRIEGLSISEASRITGQSESLVKVNIHRGLKRLTGIIEKA